MHQPYATGHMNKCKYGGFMSEHTNSMSPPPPRPPYGIAWTWMRALSWQPCVRGRGWAGPHSSCLPSPSFHPAKFSVWLDLHARSEPQNFVGQLGGAGSAITQHQNLRPDSASGLSEPSRCFHSSTSMDPGCEVLPIPGLSWVCVQAVPQG